MRYIYSHIISYKISINKNTYYKYDERYKCICVKLAASLQTFTGEIRSTRKRIFGNQACTSRCRSLSLLLLSWPIWKGLRVDLWHYGGVRCFKIYILMMCLLYINMLRSFNTKINGYSVWPLKFETFTYCNPSLHMKQYIATSHFAKHEQVKGHQMYNVNSKIRNKSAAGQGSGRYFHTSIALTSQIPA